MIDSPAARMGFLEKDELVGFSFQKEFLDPFVLIMKHNSMLSVHELSSSACCRSSVAVGHDSNLGGRLSCKP